MIILGIDPGAKESGIVRWEKDSGTLLTAKVVPNIEILSWIRRVVPDTEIIAIEQIRGYGLVCGDDTFDTCEWAGRFQEAHAAKGIKAEVRMIPRKEIKRHLCGNTTTNDKYVRQALIDRFGEQGTKKNPGPLYGISGHCWAALAVAVTCADNLRG